MPTKTYFLIGLAVFILLLVVFLIWYIHSQNKTAKETQSSISDRDLLQKIAREPDGFLTPQGLSETTALDKNAARMRLQQLHSAGILEQAHNSRLTAYYSLRHPLIEKDIAVLSPEPFLTVDDLLHLFKLYDYRPRDQDLIISTGLPLRLIRREMKYFVEEGIVDLLYASESYGKQSQRMYVLQEPYRTQPDKFRLRASEVDLQLRTILRNDNFIV